MKSLITGLTLVAIIATACNNASNTVSEDKTTDSSMVNNQTKNETAPSNNHDASVQPAITEMISQYLQIKNALANDNANDAASAGNAFVQSMGKMDQSSLTGETKKKWDDVSDDAREMAEHIGKSADKIDHQREHFDMLSTDMYDIVKTFGAGQKLYQDFCPMYNNKKGAIWLSETKEIKNPYYGKKMPACGSVKEEIK